VALNSPAVSALAGADRIVMQTSARLDRAVLVAFGVLVILVGANLVAIRFSNRELAPFWGAGTRFALAAILFAAIMVVRRIAIPLGTPLLGAVLFGLLDIAAFFALTYWGLVRVSAGQAAVIGALLPIVTLFLAVAHGLERLAWRAIVGAVGAVAGVALVSNEQVRGDVPLGSLLALLAAIVCGAEATIVVKRLPAIHPVAMSAVAMTSGAVVLLVLSVVAGESRTLPVQGATWAAFAYLVSVGTVGVFLLFLFVLKRWQASAVAYLFVLAPFVAGTLGAWLLGEEVSPLTALGALLVLAGVYVGALAPAMLAARAAKNLA
jgi:drug/metabolite transporter (DMT)-like permease